MSEHIKWFVLLTRSNFEQTVCNSMIKKKIPVFLPKIKRKSIRKDRNLVIEVPLFPGYLFVQSTLEPSDQLSILKTIGAVRLLGHQTGPVPVPESQIESLKILTSANMDLVTGINTLLKSGDRVMILQGPLAGVKGEFLKQKGRGRVFIKIDALKQYAGVEVSEDNIEKVSDLLA